jgi:hypothetical protein
VGSHLSASSFPHRGPRVRASSPHGTTRHGSGATRPCLRLKGRRPDWTVRTPPTARRLARPPLQRGFEAVRAATTVRSLTVHASSRQPPFEHRAAVSLSERRVTAAPSAPTAPVFLHAAGEVPRYLLLHAAFLHAAAPTSFRWPHPFCSPCRTPLAAALLRCLHPKLGSAAFLAPVRSPSCSLLVPLTRAAMRATLLSSPHNVTPPHRCARAGTWALCSGRLARWAASLPRARAAPGKTVSGMHCASWATLALWPWAACYYATGPWRSRPVGR